MGTAPLPQSQASHTAPPVTPLSAPALSLASPSSSRSTWPPASSSQTPTQSSPTSCPVRLSRRAALRGSSRYLQGLAGWTGRGLWHCGHLPSSRSTSLPQHLEQSLEELDLTSFGLMDTTLEEVFLKVSEEDQSLENSDVGMGAGGAQGATGASEGLCDLAGLGGCRSLLSQVVEGFPAEPIPAKGSQPLLHSGFTPTWNSV